MNERHDDIDLVTEERLRRAVRFRDAEVATAPGAIGRIRRRALEQPASPGWLRPGTILGAAAAVMVVAGLAFAFRDGDRAPDVATGTSGNDTEPQTDDPADGSVTPPSSSPRPPTTSTVPPTTSTPTLPILTPQQRAELGLVVWPLDSRSFQDATTVVFSYANQALGIDDPHFEIEAEDDGVAFVTIAQRGEDGAAFGEATRLDLVALDEFNWVVVRADSSELEIESIRFEDEGLATVTGSGRSFEGAARIVSRSICDPEGVITPVMVGGGPEFGEFVQTVAFVPCPDSALVVELATEEVLEDGVPFVSAVAYFESATTAPDSDVVWSIMPVEPDDWGWTS